MRISIFGLGYVGTVSAGCLADAGHVVVGVDPNHSKVAMVNAGKTPVIEKDIGNIIQRNVAAGRLRATTAASEAIAGTDLSMVCVGTPSLPNGSLDTSFIVSACAEIGHALRNKREQHTVVVRSTVLPGTMRGLVIPNLEEASGKRVGIEFQVCSNPEFLREGSAVSDFHNPPKSLIGEYSAGSAAGDALASLYLGLGAPLIRTDIETAEMVKYADNTWHALKVAFANEIGAICKASGVDSHAVMDILCQDTKLNLSSYYMKPGFSFGGSCLPKDVRALAYMARSQDLDTPLISAIMPSNRAHTDRGLAMIQAAGRRRVGVLGFSFKAGTDDLRESPLVEIIERLLGKGYDLRVYDKNVNLAKLVGANRQYILEHIPHIAKLMVDDIDSVLEFAETIVIGNSSDEFHRIVNRINKDQNIIDLVRIARTQTDAASYEGIAW